MPDPIYPIRRGQDGVQGIPAVERRQPLLSPQEREQARLEREEARRKVREREAKRTPPKKSPKGGQGGVDYSA